MVTTGQSPGRSRPSRQRSGRRKWTPSGPRRPC
jgi:hypothetical protein